MAEYRLKLKFPSTYKIKTCEKTLADWNAEDNSHDFEINYNSNSSANKFIRIKTESKEYTMNYEMPDFSLKKEIYHPGHLQFKLTLSNVKKYNITTPTKSEETENFIVDLPKALKNVLVDLIRVTNEKDVEKKKSELVAENYPLCNFQLRKGCTNTPKKENGKVVKDANDNIEYTTTSTFYLLIDAYSPDYYLTLDKSTKAYTGRKLWNDVIMPYIPVEPIQGCDNYEELKEAYDQENGTLKTSFWPKSLMDQINFRNEDLYVEDPLPNDPPKDNPDKTPEDKEPEGEDNEDDSDKTPEDKGPEGKDNEDDPDKTPEDKEPEGEDNKDDPDKTPEDKEPEGEDNKDDPDKTPEDKEPEGDDKTYPIYKIRMNFNHLRYNYSGIEEEFIHPYLVQYDETPFEFLTRVLNRCGEYFYYEKGTFVFGWIEPSLLTESLTTDKHQLSDVEKIITTENGVSYTTPSDKDRLEARQNIYSSENYKTDLTRDNGPYQKRLVVKIYSSFEDKSNLLESSTVTSIVHNYTETKEENKKAFTLPKDTGNINNKSIRYNQYGVTADENNFILPKKDEYINESEEYPWNMLFTTFMDCLSIENLSEIVTDIMLTQTVALGAQGEFYLNAKKGYENNIYNKGPYPSDRTIGNSTDIMAYSTGDKKYTGFTVPFISSFYQKTERGINDAENRRIKLDLGSNPENYSVFLGSIISFNNEDYVVVSVEESYTIDSDKNKVPTFHLEALPYKAGNDNSLYPPMLNDNQFIKKSNGAQRAYIAVNSDPLRMNRVRVRFAWQSDKDDSSPWIRMTVPMAGNERGFNFTPDVGDEAIINFEDNNIERPYVEGMVFNKDNKISPRISNRVAAQRSITSGNGHSIIFSDPKNGLDAIKGFVPAWGFISSLVPIPFLGGPGGFKDKDGKPTETNEKFSTAVGGIDMADKIGFYKISMSTNKRTISIDSPIGKVDINAFTGINISAPLGNINIEGKNVTIKARNNLTLESGTYMEPFIDGAGDAKKKYDKTKAVFKQIGLNLFKRFMPIDMGLIRTIYEAFLRPVGGVMSLKSHTNVCLSAGDSTINQLGIDTNYNLYNEIYENLKDLELVLDTCCASYPSTEDVEDIINDITVTYEYTAFTEEHETKVEDDLKNLKNGTKIPLDQEHATTKEEIDAINEMNAQRKNLKNAYERYKDDESYLNFIKDTAKCLNVSEEVRSFISRNILDVLDKEEVTDNSKLLGFGNDKLVTYKKASNIEAKRRFFFEAFEKWYKARKDAASLAQEADQALPLMVILDTDTYPSGNFYTTDEKWEKAINGIQTVSKKSRNKGGSFFKNNWGLKGFSSEAIRRQRQTGKILYASGDSAFTYALNQNRPELFSSSSFVAIGKIKELLKNI